MIPKGLLEKNCSRYTTWPRKTFCVGEFCRLVTSSELNILLNEIPSEFVRDYLYDTRRRKYLGKVAKVQQVDRGSKTAVLIRFNDGGQFWLSTRYLMEL